MVALVHRRVRARRRDPLRSDENREPPPQRARPLDRNTEAARRCPKAVALKRFALHDGRDAQHGFLPVSRFDHYIAFQAVSSSVDDHLSQRFERQPAALGIAGEVDALIVDRSFIPAVMIEEVTRHARKTCVAGARS